MCATFLLKWYANSIQTFHVSYVSQILNCTHMYVHINAFFRTLYRLPSSRHYVHFMCNKNGHRHFTHLPFSLRQTHASKLTHKQSIAKSSSIKMGKIHMKWKESLFSQYFHPYNSWCVRSIGWRDGADIRYIQYTSRLIDFRRYV